MMTDTEKDAWLDNEFPKAIRSAKLLAVVHPIMEGEDAKLATIVIKQCSIIEYLISKRKELEREIDLMKCTRYQEKS